MIKPLPADSADSAAAETSDLRALLREFGSPLFVVSEPALRGAYRDLRQAFPSYWVAATPILKHAPA